MKAFVSRLHAAEFPGNVLYRGKLRPHHDAGARGSEIEAGLREAGLQCVPSQARGDLAEVRQLHDPGYLDYLRTAWAAWRAQPDAADEVRPNVSPNRYFASTRPHAPVALAGRYLADGASPIVAQTWDGAWASAETALDGAQALLDGDRAAYALCRPSGHHALADMAMGGCFLANAALAAERLAARWGRVAVLDIDMHHGNGTQQLFYGRADVLTVSIHGDPADFYPFYCGYDDETGSGEGEGFNLNLPLARGTRIDGYLSALDIAMQRIADFAPRAVVVPVGYDTYIGDAFGTFEIETPDYFRIGWHLTRLGVPTLFVQEGGYAVRALRANARTLVAGFLGD